MNFDNEYHAETVRLALYFRKHCIEVFEEWWRSELPPEQGFCPSCNSFSTEIVVYHESTDEMCRKNYSILNKDPTGGLMFRFFDPTLFYSKRLCSQCSNVLRNFFQHRYCMVREIGKADVMTKYAMMHMIMRILRDAVEEIADTKELRNILNNLEQYLKSYLKSVYNDEKSEIISRYFDAVEEIFEHFKRELTGLRREFHDRKYYNGFVTE
uniref:Uncharacterized protein n=1 Tax=Caenorhabditis japonica TaxID=281687 RepID=A0A8R1IRT7_CAEJA